MPTQVDSPNIDVLEEAIIRKSPRLQKKNNSGKAVIKLAQDLVAKKCGIIHNDESLDQMTLKKYLDLYQQPLTDKYMEAILKLTEVAVDKAKKKKKNHSKAQERMSKKKTKEAAKGLKKENKVSKEGGKKGQKLGQMPVGAGA
jgi:hypothetical protein